MKVQFANAWILYLLWLVPAVGMWWYTAFKRNERNLELFISRAMQKKLQPSASSARYKWQTGLLTGAIFLAMLAAARPQWGQREETVYQRSRDVIIAVDVSRSMLANDVYPNRLQRAKADIMDLIRDLNGDRAALLAFRKTAVLICPLTTDYAFLRQALDSMSIDSAPAGETNIGDALTKAMEALESSDDGAHKAIVLISDGEDLSGQVLAAAEKAAEKKIPVFTVGLGSTKGSRIPEEVGTRTYSKYKGEDIVTRMNFETLKAISEKTGGAYIGVETASMTSVTLGTLYNNHLRNISAREVEETRQRQYVERYQYFLLPAVILMLTACFLSRGRLSRGASVSNEVNPAPATAPAPEKHAQATPPPLPVARSIALALLCTLAGFRAEASTNTAQTESTETNRSTFASTLPRGREGARKAQSLYLLGKYEESAQAYLEAAKTMADSGNRNARFNAAVALYKAGRHKAAADILKDVVLSGKQQSPEADVALGASLYEAAADAGKSNAVDKAEFLKQSGEAFREAARSEQFKDESLRNLAVILEAMPQAGQEALISRMMARYGSKQAADIADEMLANQRSILKDIPAAFSNDSPSRITLLESLAKRQRDNSDLWIPLKGKLLQEIAGQQNQTNAQQNAAYVNQAAETVRDKMKNAAAGLRDLNPEGFGDAASSEAVVYQFWKAIAPYSMVLREDILRQTNSVTLMQGAPPDEKRAKAIALEQDEAARLTAMFEERFLAAFPDAGTAEPVKPQARPADTNQPPSLSPEDRARILDLTRQAKGLQKSAQGLIAGQMFPEAAETGTKANEVLKEIEKLLPKDKQQKQDQKNDDNKKDDKKQDQQPQPGEQPPEQKKDEPAKPAQEQKDKKEMSEDQLKALLEKAVQREKEHEEERRQRNRIPPIGVDKDW